MRGKPPHKRFLTALGRNIPAYAGKTMTTMDTTKHHKEHPRVCGENVYSLGAVSP